MSTFNKMSIKQFIESKQKENKKVRLQALLDSHKNKPIWFLTSKSHCKDFIVIGEGNRGTHGCTDQYKIMGHIQMGYPRSTKKPMSVNIAGQIIDQGFCNYCNRPDLIGFFINWKGTIWENYYEHPYIQL